MNRQIGLIPPAGKEKEMGLRPSGLVVANTDPEKLLEQLREAKEFNSVHNSGELKETNDGQLEELIDIGPFVVQLGKDLKESGLVRQGEKHIEGFGLIQTPSNSPDPIRK